MGKKPIQSLIIREGLIILGLFFLGLLIIRINMAANYFFVKTYMYSPLENELSFQIVSYANYDNINTLGFAIAVFGYPLYLLICFFIWALRKLNNQNKDEKTVKQKIGIRLIGASLIFMLVSLFSYMFHNQNLHKLFFCIFCSIFALSLRAFFYIPILKEEPLQDMDKAKIKKANIDYFHYSIFLVIFSCFIYLEFYNTIHNLNLSVFYFLFAFLLGGMAFVIATIIGFIVERASKFVS